MRKRIMRRVRKNIMQLGTIVREEVLNKDEEGNIEPDKRKYGYCVEAVVNGWHICAPDDSWYMAYKGCLEAAKACLDMESGFHTPEEFKKEK